MSLNEGVRLTTTEETWRANGLALASFVQDRLGVDHAAYVDPEILAFCAHAAYLGEGARLLLLDPQATMQDAVSRLDENTLRENGTTRERVLERYPALIGNGDYAQGEITKAIGNARTRISEHAADTLEQYFANLMTFILESEPTLAGKSTVALSADAKALLFRGIPFYALPSVPGLVVEYGPGTSGANRVRQELVPQNGRAQTIYIEKGNYIPKILASMGRFYGVAQPRLIVRNEGVAVASQQLLEAGMLGKADLITASMVHSAGLSDLSTGIKNAHALLRQGGILALQVAHGVKQDEAEGIDVLNKTLSTFGDPVKIWHGTYMQSTTNTNRAISQAIFVR